MQLQGRVLSALLTAPRPDPARVLHHAIGAGDDEAVVRYGPAAAKQAADAGAYRQAAACCAEVLRRGHLLAPVRRAILTEARAWALNNLNEQRASAEEAEEAVRLWEAIGDERRLSHGLVILSRQQRATERPADARAAARRALALLESAGDSAGHALARMNVGALDILLDREEAGLPLVEESLALAVRVGAAELVALGHNYRGLARMLLGDPDGAADLRHSIELARSIGSHEAVMRGFHNLVEGLWRLGRFGEAAAELDQAESYGRDRDFPAVHLHDRRPTTPVAGRARRVGGGGGGPPRDARRRRRGHRPRRPRDAARAGPPAGAAGSRRSRGGAGRRG